MVAEEVLDEGADVEKIGYEIGSWHVFSEISGHFFSILDERDSVFS